MVGARFRSTKFLVVRALRAAGLLRFADECKFVLGNARSWLANRRFRKRYPEFATPPSHLAFDALNHVNWEQYRDSGMRHAALFARIIREEVQSGEPLEVLEWGCGPGRLIRHIADLLPGTDVSLTGADYNAESIGWCRQNLRGIAFVENGLNPPLPFQDAKFDVIYSFSVFTHLSEAVQLAWAGELRRVLKPGGLLALTTHGEAHRYLLADQSELRAFNSGQLVVQGRYQEGRKWFLAIHPEAFVRKQLLKGWEGIRRFELRPEDDVLQETWIARKPVA